MTELIRRHAPDVLLYDIGEDAAQEFRILKETKKIFNTGISIIAFSDIRSEAAVRDFIRSGGSGYLLKTCPVEECIEAIRKVVRGRKYFSQELMGEIFSGKSVLKYDPEGQKIYDGYTPHRKKVLRFFMEEKSDKEIADCLGIEPGTVEYHIKNDTERFQRTLR